MGACFKDCGLLELVPFLAQQQLDLEKLLENRMNQKLAETMGNDLLVKGVPERVLAPPPFSLIDPACPAEAARELLLELLQQVAG